jgi:hypothetical protein
MRAAPLALLLCCCCCCVLVVSNGGRRWSATDIYGAKQGAVERLSSPEMEIARLEKQLAEAKQEIAALKKSVTGEGTHSSAMPKLSVLAMHATPMTGSCLLRLPLTIESMRLNPEVSFHVVNLVDEEDEGAAGVHALRAAAKPVKNVHVHVITIPKFVELVKTRLMTVSEMPEPQIYNASHMMTKSHDYKPTFGVLWDPLFEADGAEYWGWFDMDQVFGNFESVISPYIPENDLVMSCLAKSCGPFMLFRRKFRTVEEQESFAAKSGLELTHISARLHPVTTIAVNTSYFMSRIAKAKHSMADEGGFDHIIRSRDWKKSFGPAYGKLKAVGFSMFLEELMSVGVPGWTRGHEDLQSPEGIVLWRGGKLTVLATGRELLFYHRITQPDCLGRCNTCNTVCSHSAHSYAIHLHTMSLGH